MIYHSWMLQTYRQRYRHIKIIVWVYHSYSYVGGVECRDGGKDWDGVSEGSRVRHHWGEKSRARGHRAVWHLQPGEVKHDPVPQSMGKTWVERPILWRVCTFILNPLLALILCLFGFGAWDVCVCTRMCVKLRPHDDKLGYEYVYKNVSVWMYVTM